MAVIMERIPDMMLEKKLVDLDQAIESHECLEIDGDYEKDGICYLKILKHAPGEKGIAYGVSIETIKETSTQVLIEALESGITNPLFGITRIVGYYSRISNWNKSKLGELKDRHKGNYSVG